MSFSASLRRCAPSAARILRQEATFQNAIASSSTQAASKKQTRQTRSALPREKLRALVSLYHQADTFITQENLIEKINEALLNETKEKDALTQMPTPAELYAVVDRRRAEPKIADVVHSELSKTPSDGENWSAQKRNRREKKVIEALYGLNMSNPQGIVRPGLEAVENAIPELLANESLDRKQV